MAKKIITIVGATGNQGTSTARTFLSLPNWHVRALTRNPSSPSAQELSSLGAEVVQANLDDPSTLPPALDGSHAIFVLTTFLQSYTANLKSGMSDRDAGLKSYNLEVAHSKAVAEAAAKVPTLERFVYSGLGPMEEASGGKYPRSYHWEGKADSIKWIKQNLPHLAAKMSVLYPAAYASNQFLTPKRGVEDGEYALLIPAPEETKMPIIDEQGSVGAFVRCLVEDEAPETNLLAYDSDITLTEVRRIWERKTGRKAAHVNASVEKMVELTGISAEIMQGPAYLHEFGYMAGVGPYKEPRDLKNPPETKSYEEYLQGRDNEELLSLVNPKFAGPTKLQW